MQKKLKETQRNAEKKLRQIRQEIRDLSLEQHMKKTKEEIQENTEDSSLHYFL